MRFPPRFTAALSFAMAVLAGHSLPLAVAGSGTFTFRVCQYNIHFDYEDDGPEHRWVKRRDLCSGLLLGSGASVACIQEDKPDQVEDLKQRMPGWEFVGRGRNQNGTGERTCVCFKTDTWKCVEHGDFWLSDTPDVPASNTWGSQYCHKATWALLEPIAEPRVQIIFISTHLDDRPNMDEQRRKSAVCIREYIKGHFKGANIVVCGDFNSAVTDESHKVMADTSIEPPLYDTWDTAEHHETSSGTVHHWTGTAKTKRIDWIFTGGKVTGTHLKFDRYNKDGQYGSYHFGVDCDMEVVVDPNKKPKAPEKPAPPPITEPKQAPKPGDDPKGGVPDETPPSEPGLSPLDPPKKN
jgi:endonuclease/exonuclease/phosphatase family metal-dependent hydrolase